MPGMYRTAFMLTVILLALTSMADAQPERYLPDRDYTVIANPLPDRSPDIVEVTEYFWYGCPGCFAFEPQLADWMGRQAGNVQCLRLPAIWDDWREVHARAYYTAMSLGVLDKMHDKLFHAMHREGNRLRDEDELMALFTKNGVNEAAFRKAYNSFTVNSEITRAKNLALQAGVHSTPSIIVNGKYVVMLSGNTLDIVDFLIRKELM